MIVISFVLVFFPACIALLLHDHLMPIQKGAAQRWLWYGAYCAIISWMVLMVKFIRLGGSFTILNAFQQIRSLVSYGLVALILALVVPLVLSIVKLPLEKLKVLRDNHRE